MLSIVKIADTGLTFFYFLSEVFELQIVMLK